MVVVEWLPLPSVAVLLCRSAYARNTVTLHLDLIVSTDEAESRFLSGDDGGWFVYSVVRIL